MGRGITDLADGTAGPRGDVVVNPALREEEEEGGVGGRGGRGGRRRDQGRRRRRSKGLLDCYLREDDHARQATIALHNVPKVRLALAADVMRCNLAHVAPLEAERLALVVDDAATHTGRSKASVERETA